MTGQHEQSQPPGSSPPARASEASVIRYETPPTGIVTAVAGPFVRADWLVLLGVVLLALIVRVTYVYQMQSSPLFEHPGMDDAYHHEWATAIAEGRTFVDGPYFRAPLYPWFLGTIYTLFGPGFLLPRLIQAVIGALSCGLVFLLGREAFGRATGALAGLAAATYWIFCYFDAELLIVSLIVFLDLVLLWCLLRARRGPHPVRWLIAGVILGLSAIARPNILAFIPVLILWIVWTRTPQRARASLVFCLGCLIPILPITVRNYVVGDDLVLISSQAGVNFFIGNNPYSDGVTAVVPGTPGDWWGGYYGSIRIAEQASGRKLKPSEVSRFYFRQAFRFWARMPGAALKLSLHKLRLFWDPHELGNNKDPRFFATHFAPVVRFLPLSFAIVVPLALAGIVLRRREWLRLVPLWSFVLVYMCTVVAYFINARYRVPVAVVLILFAADAVIQVIRWATAREFRQAAGAILLAAFFALLIRSSSGNRPVQTDSHSYHVLANINYELGQYDKALGYARKWADLEPGWPDPHVLLAECLHESERTQEALTELRQTLASSPGHPGALKALTAILAAEGRHGEAIEALRRAISQTPHDMGIASRLAWFLATSPQDDLRDGEEAMQLVLGAIVATKGEVADVLEVQAAVYAELGRFDEAQRTAERALDIARNSHQDRVAARLETQAMRYQTGRSLRE